MLPRAGPLISGVDWTKRPGCPVMPISSRRVSATLRGNGLPDLALQRFHVHQGLRPWRWMRRCRNTDGVMAYLFQAQEDHQGDPSEQQRRGQAPRRRLPGASSAMIGFELEGGREAVLSRCAQGILHRQYRRCALARNPSRFDHAFATLVGESRPRPASPIITAASVSLGKPGQPPCRSRPGLAGESWPSIFWARHCEPATEKNVTR